MNKLKAVGFIGIFLLTALFLRGKIPHEKFDSNLWKTANLNTEANMSLRWDMMNDLRSWYKLLGMTKEQIVDLLGNPTNKTLSAFYYDLGFSKRGINTGNFTIIFNEKGVVTSFRVWQG